MARVLWRDAQGIEGALDLGAQEIRVGRSMDCAIRTDDAMVSRHHARLYWGGQGFVLEDLGSANGVYYQEQRVQSHLLKHGDAVRCGSLWLRFVDTAQLGNDGGGNGGGMQPQANQAQPLMQHPGMGPVNNAGPTGHAMQAVSAQQLAAVNAQIPQQPQQQPGPPPPQAQVQAPPPAVSDTSAADHEEMKRLRRRIDQLQSELRIMRGGKPGMNAEKARKMEDLEKEMAGLEEERDTLKAKVATLEEQLRSEGANVKVQRAVEIRGKAAEIVTALNDLLSSLRIEVMAAEGEFDQYSHTIPRASFELIRQSLRESAGNVDQARDLLRQLREVAG
ncbi:MAG: FHA domain-containing protein [Deltaproteobacteria bacterium]|nr:FHA domain-containing protein [Deltaproteobacteria bacterium]